MKNFGGLYKFLKKKNSLATGSDSGMPSLAETKKHSLVHGATCRECRAAPELASASNVFLAFLFCCWVTNGKHGEEGRGDGEVRHWVLGGGGYGPPWLLPRYLYLVAHCQNAKSGHLVPSVCAFQHNWA